MEVNVSFKDIDLCVTGVYTEAEEYSNSKSEFEIESVYVIDSSIDIFDFFSANDLTEIQDLVLNNI